LKRTFRDILAQGSVAVYVLSLLIKHLSGSVLPSHTFYYSNWLSHLVVKSCKPLQRFCFLFVCCF